MTDDTTDQTGGAQPDDARPAAAADDPADEDDIAQEDVANGSESVDDESTDDDRVLEEVANGGAATADQGAGEEAADAEQSTDQVVAQYLLKGALVMLIVLGVVATLQFYLAATRAITRMTAPEYGPLFHAAFNLVVLLAVGIGIAQVVRRLR